MTSHGPPRSARPPGTDWQDSYFTLEERFRQLQKTLNEKDNELKLLKVAQRKSAAVVAAAQQLQQRNTSTASASVTRARAALSNRSTMNATAGGATPASPAKGTVASPSVGAASPVPLLTHPSGPSASPHPVGETAGAVNVENVYVPSTASPDAVRAAALAQAAQWTPAATLPDPSMVWGAEGSVQNYVAASALYHANEELRRKLDESSTLIQSLQQELSATRTLCTHLQAKTDDITQQMHQLVRERDLATQKLSSSKLTVTELERTLQERISEEERVRFSLESQITELRSRLVVGADSNELLNRDVRALLSETKERTGEVMSLRSKLALVESALSSQKHANESLLVELTSLNSQLVEERKRVVIITREAQMASLDKERVRELEEHATRLREERVMMEREHVRLMGEFVRVTESALRHAREEVATDLKDWRDAAQHWEQVAQLLYKDIAERTQTHLRCRAECEEAKTQRDAAVLELRRTQEELTLSLAKLDVVWPSHRTDTADLTAEDILDTFGRRSGGGGGGGGFPVVGARAAQRRAETAEAATGAEVGGKAGDEGDSLDLPPDPTTVEERVRELQEANAGLVADMEQLRLSNDLLQERIKALAGKHAEEKAALAATTATLQKREAVGQHLLEKQLDRVGFLEAQVRSLRGYQVEVNTELQQVNPNENVFELFLGQMVAAEVPAGLPVPDHFANVFCSIDFLLHETITTPTVIGFNGFFDTTAAFRISMDTLLLYYLQTRDLLVQLHRVRSAEEVDAMRSMNAEAHTLSPPKTAGDTGGGGSSHAHESRGALQGQSSFASTDSGSRHSSVKLAERMFETIAEGRVSLLELLLDEHSRTSDRPTLKSHITLRTPQGQALAFVEFRLTARLPFSPTFLQQIHDTFAAHGESPVATAAVTDVPRAAAALGSPSSSRDLTRQQRGKGGEACRGGERSAVAGTTPTGKPYGSRATTQPSGLQLLPSSSDSSASTHSSWIGGHGHGADIIRLRSSPPPAGQLAPPATGGGEGVHGARRDTSAVTDASSSVPHFTHVSHSLLRGQGGGQGIVRVVWVDVVRVELPTDLPSPIPRLSCLCAIGPLNKVVQLAAPASPRYTIEYTQEDRELGTPFPVSTLFELATVAREPLTLFLVDEDAERGRGGGGGPPTSVWAVAVCEWAAAMEHLDQVQSCAVPVFRHGAVLPGAAVRVRLLVSTGASAPPRTTSSDPPSQQRNASAVVASLSSPQRSPPSPRGAEAAAGPSTMSSSPPPPPPPPSVPVAGARGSQNDHAATLQELLSQLQQLHQQVASAKPSMEEELLRLEYQRTNGGASAAGTARRR